jgi:hypothetical protein
MNKNEQDNNKILFKEVSVMKKVIFGILCLYLFICGFALSSADQPASNDVIMYITVNVNNTNGTITPAVDNNFNKMCFSEVINYNNTNPKKATQCTIEIRVPAVDQTAVVNAISTGYTNCTITSVTTIPVPTPTAIAQIN